MNLIDKKVVHKRFGKGNVVNYNQSYIDIKFKSGVKKFVFPDVFGEYVTLVDQNAADVMDKKVKKRRNKLEKEALKQQKEEALAQERRKILRQRKSGPGHKGHPELQSVFWCSPQEEDEIFTKWQVFVGRIKSGEREGEPRRLARLNQNSACLITIRDPDMPEEDRRIVGAFMVRESFDGRDSEDGYIPAHDKYRFHLSREDSQKMLFWNYYQNKRFPDRIVWNSGRHRYFDNIWMAQILRDIVGLKEKSPEAESLQEFFDYFCSINEINKNELPEADGPLARH